MMQHRPLLAMLALLFACLSGATGQQDDPMIVQRIKAVDQNKPIYNIYVDEDNNKWIGNSEAIFFVEAKNRADKRVIPAGQQSLMQLPGGDADIRWSISEIKGILGDAIITTAAYDDRDRTLWIGTDGYGVYKIRVSEGGGLRLIEEIYIDNSKLRSDFINRIYISPRGKVWIATEDGAMLIEGGSSSMHQKFFNIQTISGDRRSTWATGDGIVWIIDDRNNWRPIEIDKFEIEGEMHDIALDEEGKIWIASNIMTSYKIDADYYQHFGPGQYFTSQFVNYVSVDEDGTIWVGSDDKGVYIIEKASTITVTQNLDKALSCDGSANDAAMTINAIGGAPPYEYLWSDGGKGERRQNLGPGTYTITVTDTQGSSKEEEIEIPDPTVSVTLTVDAEESDQGASDGGVSLIAEGGVPGYNALWSNGSTAAMISGVPAGLYSVTVTDKAGCTATAEIEVPRKVGKLAVNIEVTSPIPCPGASGAVINAVVDGGKEPFAYAWQDLEGSSPMIGGLEAGMYVVTVTDALGTTVSTSVVVENPKEFTAEITMTQPASTNNEDGAAEVIVTGGTEPFNYTWSNGATTSVASGLGPIQHTVTVTDANGCSTTASITVTEDILPLAVSIEQQQDILCAGESSGGLVADIQGGKGPYLYEWSNGTSNESITDLPAGTYAVTVTDVLGASASFETSLDEPEPILVNSAIDAVASTSNADGTATLTVTGGIGGYTYQWSTGGTTANVSNLAAGDYDVTVTDANGCSAVVSVKMTENILPLSVSIEQVNDILCSGELSGSLIADISGGKGPFTYEWSNGALGETAEGLGAGFYTVTVTDVTGSTTVFETELTEPEKLVVNAVVEQSATTDAQDGVATINVSGGEPDYAYAWSNGSTSQSVDNLGAGEFTITVTDINGCSGTASVTMTENILPLSVSLDGRTTSSCFGDNDGQLTATVNGGKGPFRYQWNNSTGDLQANDTQTSLEGLAPGIYSLTVTDAVENEATFQIEIKEPSQLIANIVIESPASTDLSDGKARVEASGGSPTYSYAWDSGENAALASTLSAGEHIVTVTDEAGCTTIATVEMTEDILPLQGVITQSGEINCNGEATAVLTAETVGGKGPFEYAWPDGTSGPTISNLGAGTYEVTVTDALGSTAIKSFTVLEPTLLVVNANVSTVASTDASDGALAAAANGGTEPYTYAWSNGQNGSEIEGLGIGDYSVTVTDGNGCTAYTTIPMTENILPLTLDVERDVSQIVCNGDKTGIITTLPQGGKGPFTFIWSDGGSATAERTDLGEGTYTITVTDALGSTATATVPIQHPDALIVNALALAPASTEGKDGSAEVEISGGIEPYTVSWEDATSGIRNDQLGPGSHLITVTDDNGCTATASVEISENILPLNANIEQTSEILCNGDRSASIAVNTSGGKGPFTFIWSDGDQRLAERAELPNGAYTVTVTDSEGTTATNSIDILQPEALIVNTVVVSTASTDASDGSARAEASGGTPPYNFSWAAGSNEPAINTLAAGEHVVTVTDANGCIGTASLTMTENILPLSATITIDNEILCGGESTGGLTIEHNGGKGPYTYAWSDGGTDENRANLVAGNYVVTVTDALGTEFEATATLQEPEVLTASAVNMSPASAAGNDGAAEITVKGGIAPYAFAWDDGNISAAVDALTTGTHNVTVTDANGCTQTLALEITENILPLEASIEETSAISCAGLTDGRVAARTQGGKGPFTYSWSNGGNGDEITNAASGALSVTVTDATGQTSEASIQLEEPDAMSIEITDVRAAAAEHVPDGKGTVVVNGGSGGFSYAWDNGENAQKASQLGIGNHSVTVTDANGCTAVASTEITQKIIPALTAENLASGQPLRLEKLQFEADSIRITNESLPTLEELYDFLYDNPTIVVEIGGHTNGLPEHDYCDSLSTARAKSVATWIVDAGIDSKRIYYKGYGKRRPVATNRTPEGRRKNQRVEVRILKLEDTN